MLFNLNSPRYLILFIAMISIGVICYLQNQDDIEPVKISRHRSLETLQLGPGNWSNLEPLYLQEKFTGPKKNYLLLRLMKLSLIKTCMK